MDSMAQKPILFDTCIFIDYLRSNPKPGVWIDKVIREQIEGKITTLVDFELWCGVKNNLDAKRHKILLSKFSRVNIHVTIARRAGELAYPFKKAHDKSISAVDFITAAAAEYYDFDILTDNRIDFIRLPLRGTNILTYGS